MFLMIIFSLWQWEGLISEMDFTYTCIEVEQHLISLLQPYLIQGN